VADRLTIQVADLAKSLEQISACFGGFSKWPVPKSA